MPLTPGSRLGRYEIRGLVGAGGMGEVYRAHDASLKREVALKVLPGDFAGDPSRLRRFQQEALATAALNHPHIVAVYDAGTHEQTAYVVAELLEGRTLKDVMTAGPLPPRKAVGYATQIASGLAAAHEKGIVHRDLKPANVFVTTDERVKILDFGLARVMDGSPMGAGGETATVTVPGTILGTVGYMAPEQVRGEAADSRADIFAFGVILYELVTGRRAFHRETIPGTLAAILHDDLPAWSGDGSALSLRLMRLVQRCVEKSPAARFQSARDLMLVLSDEISDASIPTAPLPPRRGLTLIAAAVAGAALLLLLGIWLGRRTGPAAPGTTAGVTPATFKVILPEGETSTRWPPEISADGRRIAFALARERVTRIWVYTLETGDWQFLKGTENGREPFFSPDGQQVGFVQDIDDERAKLSRVGLDGSGPFDICDRDCDAQSVRGASWGDDNRIVFGSVTGGLRRVPAVGGTVETITAVDKTTEVNHRFPQVLPGSTRVIFTVTPKERPSRTRVAASVIGSQQHVILLDDGRSAQYVSGHLVYVKQVGEVHVVPFDPAGLAVAPGPSVALRERPGGGSATGDAALRVSGAGAAVYVRSYQQIRRVMLANRQGDRKPTLMPPAPYSVLNASPNGRLLLASVPDGLEAVDVFLFERENGTKVRVTQDDNSRYPIWGPDGASVIYSIRSGAEETIWMRQLDANGRPSGDARKLVGGTVNAGPFSTVGRMLFYGQSGARSQWDAWRMSLDNPDQRELVVERPWTQYAAAVSPSGKWLTYVSNERKDDKGGQRPDIYVTTYPVLGSPKRIAEGMSPQWSRSGDELFFIQGNRLYSQRFNAGGPAATPPSPTGVDGIALSGGPGLMSYSELPDGWFVILVAEPDPADARTPIVVLNWAAQIKGKK